MKKKLIALCLGTATLIATHLAFAQTSPNFWILNNSNLKPISNSWGLQIVSTPCTGSQFYQSNANGIFQCGTPSGGGSGSFNATGTPNGLLIFTGTSTGTSSISLTFSTTTLTLTTASATITGTISSTLSNALVLASSSGQFIAFATQTCGNGTAVQVISATGTVSCVSVTASGGNGTVTTSSVVTINQIPYWASSSGLNGTSSLTFVPATGALNVSGTISQSGIAVLTTSTWVINSSGTIIQIVNQGGSSTIGVSQNLADYNNNANFVVNTRNINTGSELSGGGNLTADRTISFVNPGFVTNASSITQGGLAVLTTSTWAIAASGTNIVTYNQGGSSTIGFTVSPSFVNISSTGNMDILGYLKDANGNKYATSTAGAAGTVTTSTPIYTNGLTYFPTAAGTALNSTGGIMIAPDSSLSSTALRVASATIVLLVDANNNKYSTSTSGGGDVVQLVSSTPFAANFVPVILNGNSLTNSWIQLLGNGLIIATGTNPYIPIQTSTSSLLTLGTSTIQGGNVSGTYLGVNASSGFNGDFINFQINSGTIFRVSSGTLSIGATTTAQGYPIEAHSGINNSTPFANYQIAAINDFAGAGYPAGITFWEKGSTSNLDRNWAIVASTNQQGDLAFLRSADNVAPPMAKTSTVLEFQSNNYFGLNLLNPFKVLSEFQIGGNPTSTATSTMFLLGYNNLASSSASNINGTYIGINPTSGFVGDFVNFQVASATQFEISATGTVNVIGNLFDANGNKYSTSTSGGLATQALPSSTVWLDKQILFGELGGLATTSASFTFTTSTAVLSAPSGTFSGTLTVSSSMAVGTTTLNGIFSVATPSGTVALQVNSTGTYILAVMASSTTSSTLVSATNTYFAVSPTSSFFSQSNLGFATTSVTISACGTSPTISGSNNAGTFTTGSGSPTACTISFATATSSVGAGWVNAPACVVSDASTAVTTDILSISSTTLVLNFSAALTSVTGWYVCFGNPQ